MNKKNTYNSAIGTTPVFIPTGEPITTAIASVIATTAASWNQWFTHPARDAMNFVKTIIPTLQGIDARSRLARVLAATEKIKAKDIEARDLLKVYRQTYRDDYKELTLDDMLYFNNYLNNVLNTARNDNNLFQNINASFFTQSELDYQKPKTAQTILSSPNTQKYLIVGAIGLGLLLLLKK